MIAQDTGNKLGIIPKPVIYTLRAGNAARKEALFWLVLSAQTSVTWEERASTEKLPPLDWSVGMSAGHFLD